MPSNRRLRFFATLAAVLVIVFLFFSGSSSRSDQSFYERSVAGMKAKAGMGGAAGATPSPRIPPPHPDSDEAKPVVAPAPEDVAGPAPGRQPPQVALGDDSGSKRVKGGDGWRTGKDETPAKDEKTDEEHAVEAELNSILKRSPIIIFSKTYCPFSQKAKRIFALYSITPAPFIVELDEEPLGAQLQAQLHKMTGRRTVPNVLISGKTIGGGDDVGLLHEKGELVGKVKDMGGKRIVEARLKGVKEKD